MTTHISRDASISFNPKGLSGLRSRRLVNLRAGKFRAANRGRRLDDVECRAVETQLRQDGKIQ
jgi:hypothetical protein